MPSDVGVILSRRSQRSTLLCVHLSNHLDVDVHFFGTDEIEFTFDPAQVTAPGAAVSVRALYPGEVASPVGS
jgi:hypothetical protein